MVPQIAFEVLTGIRDAASMLTGAYGDAFKLKLQLSIATRALVKRSHGSDSIAMQ